MTGGEAHARPAVRRAAEWTALGVVCPRCHGTLADDGDVALACAACGSRYPVCVGIPDLRTLGDPYLGTDEDLAAAERLSTNALRLGFGALYASYYDGNEKVPPAQVAQFTRGVLAAADRAAAALDVWTATDRGRAPDGTVLDLGCGTAPLGVALRIRGARVVGVDAGLRWLVLAHVRAREEGVDLPLVCANAEALPFRDGAFARVTGESVLENLADARAGMRECRRVLARGGALWLTTPNRRSLGPDPHLGVLAGGWWPERRLRAHAARAGQVFPRRRLFSVRELRRELAGAGFTAIRLALPRFATAQTSTLSAPLRLIVAGYHLARRIPGVRTVVLHLGPTMVISAVAA